MTDERRTTSIDDKGNPQKGEDVFQATFLGLKKQEGMRCNCATASFSVDPKDAGRLKESFGKITNGENANVILDLNGNKPNPAVPVEMVGPFDARVEGNIFHMQMNGPGAADTIEKMNEAGAIGALVFKM